METPLVNKDRQRSTKGGLKTMPFIIVNESFEKVASFGLLANMIIYLINGYHFDVATASSIIFLWTATSNFLPILGAFLSDSYMGRFAIIALGSAASLTGMILLWLTAMIPGAKPPACNPSQQSCESPTSSRIALLVVSFLMMSIGSAGVRPCSLAFGADQFNKRDNPNSERALQSFFNWYYASVGVSIMLSSTVLVYIQDNKGWKVGLGVPAILMFLSASSFLVGSPLYVKMEAKKSLLSGLVQVMVAAFTNRDLDLSPENADHVMYHQSQDSKLVAPTDKMRFLNKACIIRDSEKDLTPDGSASRPWNLCTVDQVEELKSLIKVLPMWSTSIILNVILYQNSMGVLQAKTMDRHLSPHFEIPAASIGVSALLTLTIWVAIYDRIIVPLFGKLPYKQRIGIGLLLSIATPAVAGIVEHSRRKTAIQEGLAEHLNGMVNMSVMWLLPQNVLNGLTEAFGFVGQIEFYYNELPQTMTTIGMALHTLGTAVGNLVSSLMVKLLDKISRSGGKESWMADNLNKGHIDYYYWLLAILGFLNFLYFLWCSWSYGPCKEELRGEETGEAANEEEDAP